MVEQTHAGECHGNAVLVASVDNMVIANATASLGHILDTALVSTLDVVAEGEEGIATETYIGVLSQPLLHFLLGERFGTLGEELLPFAIAQNILALGTDVDINGVVAVGTTDTGYEGEVHHLGMLTQPPDVGLIASQTGAMDTALLTGTDTDGLTVLNIADAIALCVFQCNQCDYQVTTSLLGKGLVLCGDILEQCGIGQVYLVATLLESDTEAVLALDGSRSVLGIYLDDIVCTLALCLQHLKSLGSIARSNDTIAHLTVDKTGCSLIAHIAQGNEVAIRTHAVSTTSTSIGRCNGSEWQRSVVNKVDLLQGVAQRQTHGSTSRANVLEAGGGGQTCCLLQFLYQLPRVESVQKVDVTWATIQHLDGQLTLFHENAGRFLVGITTVLQFKFLHVCMYTLLIVSLLTFIRP